jgi:hypothetical protein
MLILITWFLSGHIVYLWPLYDVVSFVPLLRLGANDTMRATNKHALQNVIVLLMFKELTVLDCRKQQNVMKIF